MTKQKKKRNKKYSGEGAVQAQPQVTRVTAIKRSKLQLWWLEKKPFVKPVSIATGVVTAIGVIGYGLIGLFF